MKKSDELLKLIQDKTEACKNAHGEEKANLFEEIKALKKDREIELELEAQELAPEEPEIENKIIEKGEDVKMENMTREQKDALALRGFIKNNMRKIPTEAEMNAYRDAIVGEEFIIPETVSTKVQELIRAEIDLAQQVGVIQTSTKSGSFPVEGFTYSDIPEFFDFTDGNDLEELDGIVFKQVKYDQKELGCFVPLSNSLLAFTDMQLINYVAKFIARSYVKTRNNKIIAKLNEKSAVEVAGVKALTKKIMTELDPAVRANSVLLVNQDAYAKLAEEEGSNKNVKYLHSDLTQRPELTICGVKIVEVPNAMLPSAGNEAPMFLGNLGGAVKVVENPKMKIDMSREAGFKQNLTLIRAIAYIDVVSVDTADEVYQVLKITL